jgi:hypothetical protein
MMRNADECRKRAEGCLRSAEANLPGREQWLWLANTWTVVAEQRVVLERGHHVFKPWRNDPVAIADILRERLALD